MKRNIIIAGIFIVLFIISAIGVIFLSLYQPSPPEDILPTPSSIPKVAWSRGIGVPHGHVGKPKTSYWIIDDNEWGGVPLGGMGAGSIGRTYRGDFARWHLDIGHHKFETVYANQFSIYVFHNGESNAHVLSPLSASDAKLEWNWDMPVGAGTYYGLFPKAWYAYNWKELPVNLIQKQFSPIIPKNYKESSYPVGIFEWIVENPTNESLTLGLMFTWQNLIGVIGATENLVMDKYNYAYIADDKNMTGVILTREKDEVEEEWDGSFAILTQNDPNWIVSYRSRFSISGGASDVWQDFAADGILDNINNTNYADILEEIGAALSVTLELEPGETQTVPFVLSWDFPITEFDWSRQWYKRYTRFFGTTGRNSWSIASEALVNYTKWEDAIDAWQQPILDDKNRPDWYKTALFNELYYLVDGGTFWGNGLVNEGPLEEGIGKFGYLECFDYKCYNTFDVLYYASFSLIQLWPELQIQTIRDFIAAVPINDPTITTIWATGESGPRKVPGSCPHDIGYEDPWFVVNTYRWRDSNMWKDMNSKFVLQLYRDYFFTNNTTIVEDGWSSVVMALDYLHNYDTDGDHLPENEGVPDQTYDEWKMSGESAYCAGLWLAALEAAIEMGILIGDTGNASIYANWLEKGKASYKIKLWNGEYFNYDSSEGPHSDSIMADQLSGQWYCDATNLAPIIPESYILSALEKIYNFNVLQFANGQMGAVNGMRPNGDIDKTSEQSQEVWTGTTYALAALMIYQGMIEEAWNTAWGIYNVVYNTNSTYNKGYWFRTPEAWDITGNYRASMYMRPQSIWAIEHALEFIN
ncbi:MAG: GH116 family glycosyl hydrolase [Promethearchaeota archaeon]